jgi:hypothetical protein
MDGWLTTHPVDGATVDDIISSAASAESAILPGHDYPTGGIERGGRKGPGPNVGRVADIYSGTDYHGSRPSAAAVERAPGNDVLQSSVP